MGWPAIGLDTGIVCTKDFAKALAALILAVDERRAALGLDALLWPYNEAGDTKAGPVSTDFVGLRINGTAIQNVVAEIRLQVVELYSGDPDRTWCTDDTFSTEIPAIATQTSDRVGSAEVWRNDYNALNAMVYAKGEWERISTFLFIGNTMLISFNGLLWAFNDSTLDNEVWSSPDGITWTLATDTPGWTGTSRLCIPTIFNSKMWVFREGIGINEVWSSPDGIIWTLATDAPGWTGSLFFNTGFSLNNTLFLIRNFSSFHEVWSSPDGITWTLATDTPGWTGIGIVFATILNGRVYAKSDSTIDEAIWSSADGATWTIATDAPGWDNLSHQAIAAIGGILWCIVLKVISEIWYSHDGLNWFMETNDPGWSPDSSNNNLCILNSRIYKIERGYLWRSPSNVFTKNDLRPYLTDQQ